MQKLIDIIVAIFGLGKAAYNNVDLDEARDFHARYIARSIWLLAGLVLIMVGINYAGYKGINIGISLFLSLVVLTIATRPEPLIAAVIAGLASGAIQRPQTMIQEVRTFLKTFFRSLGDVIFWISIFGMFLGTVSCAGNPRAVATIAIALIVIGYGSYRWEMGPVMYKTVIYGYAIFIFLFSLVSLPSHATWMHYAGFDPIGILRTSYEEELLAKIEEEIAKNESEAKIAILKNIKKDLEAKRPLKDWQETFMKTMQKERGENSIPSRVAEKFSSTSLSPSGDKVDAYVPPAPMAMPARVTAAAPGKSFEPNLSGTKWKINYGEGDLLPLDLVQRDNSVEFTVYYKAGGKMVISGNKGADRLYSGTWKLIGHPKGYLEGKFNSLHIDTDAGNGKWVSPIGKESDLSISKLS